MKYNVEVQEVLSRIITVEAPTADEALERVQKAYNASEIVLDSNDMVEAADINVMQDEAPEDFKPDYIVK
jgi:hypothetical protein